MDEGARGARVRRELGAPCASWRSPTTEVLIPARSCRCCARGSRSARRAEWLVQAVLPERARNRAWISELVGIDVRFLPDGIANPVCPWLRGLLAEEPGPTILHTHFSRFDMPAVAAAAGHPRREGHLADPHRPERGRRHARRQPLQARGRGRRVERILCVAPHLAEGVVARGAPPAACEYFPNGLDTDAHAPVSHGAQARGARVPRTAPGRHGGASLRPRLGAQGRRPLPAVGGAPQGGRPTRADGRLRPRWRARASAGRGAGDRRGALDPGRGLST